MIETAMNRRSLICGALVSAGAATAATAASAQPKTVDFKFVFLSDTHIQPEDGAVEGVHRCFAQVAASDADFVVHGGDHVFDAMEVGRARADVQMALYRQSERLLDKPVRHVLGNHDCFGLFEKSGVDPSEPGYGKRYFIDQFGPTYYGFSHKGVRFLVLDSIGFKGRNYEGRIDAEQLAWLRGEFAILSPSDPVVVLTHIPLVTALECYEPEDWAASPYDWTRVMNGREVMRLFQNHNVLGVLQGHGHVHETVEVAGVRYISSGAVAGADWRGSFLGTPEGYLEVTIANGRLDTRFRTYGFTPPRRHDVPL
ncbi:metallophosphoesterase family protein [Brevundimonas sp. TSRC1-1]|uniref:metallophosphoesterase family protein n=1 Tax=Brevundimonas sp. TSRC1-1 TaxID=2804562 RepID=UPI003CF65E5E